MKKIMCLILLILLFQTFALKLVLVKAEEGITKTGHSEIKEFDFYDEESGYRLLIQMDPNKVNDAYDKVPRKAFGYSIYKINDCIPGWYISDVLFSRSNSTNQNITFKYNYKYQKTKSLDYSITGTLALKLSGKIKTLGLNAEPTIKGEIDSSTKDFYEENAAFNFDLAPGKKISFIVRGECEVTTGVGKQFFLGITTKKGSFELMDIRTEYYELLEEDI